MKALYLAALALSFLLAQAAQAQSAPWQPFRPSYTYTYAEQGGTSTGLHALRADSAYTTAAGDSVLAFSRLLRPSSSAGSYRKSHNNLFGARLRWRPGTRDYYLEADAELLTGTPTAVSLLLRPRAAVGSSWAASAGLTATLSSRALGQIVGTPDSLATITLSSGQQLVLSRGNGLVSGPRWLVLAQPAGSPPPATWAAASRPQAGLGLYDPRSLFAMQPGAVLGYELEQLAFGGGLTCAAGYRLRRILSRQQTVDSLFITYQQQDRVVYYNAPGCSNTAGTVLGPAQAGRWAFSLQTGQSPQFPMLPQPSYGYAAYGGNPGLRPLWYNSQQQGSSASGTIRYTGLSATGGPRVYTMLIDATPTQLFTTGQGPTQGYEGLPYRLQYYCPAGSTCPPPIAYAGLLPTRAQQAATAATLYPNPAPEQATLALAAPAPAGTTATLLDALGRVVWRQLLAAGQRAVAVPVVSLPAGLYLLQLQLPGAAVYAYPLTH